MTLLRLLTGALWRASAASPAAWCAAALAVLALAGCHASRSDTGGAADRPPHFVAHPDGSVELFDGRVVPPLPELLGLRRQYELRLGWLERKREMLLPMMRRHRVVMWIVTHQEFYLDPVVPYVAPERRYTDRRGFMVFVDAGGDGLKAYSDNRRPNTDLAHLFAPFPVPRDARGEQDSRTGLRLLYEQYRPRTIALNFRGRRGQDGGLTYDSYQFLVDALGAEAEGRFISAADLIEEYFDTRLPEEFEHNRVLFEVTDYLTQRALSNEVITPGVTRAVDIKWWWEEQVARLGVGGKTWFEVHTAVQRFDPETGAMIPYVHPAPDDYVFQRGDIIHMDCGFDYLGFASDWQKVAYILQDGEEDVPEGLKLALRNANQVHEAFVTAPRPEMSGWEATLAIAGRLEGVDFLPSLYSHPIGYQGHALGPDINARDMDLSQPPEWDTKLRPGAYRSIEFSATTAVPEYDGGKVTIPMEDGAYLTDQGYEYFRPYQTSWYLIR